ncbi:MAG: hydantoinase/oxoprolinase family protein [Candidatus Heimdallarchaeaceae archaeon]
MVIDNSSVVLKENGNIAVLNFSSSILEIVILDPEHCDEPLAFQRMFLPIRQKREELEGVLKTLLRSYADYHIRKFIITIKHSFFSTAKETMEFVIDSITKFIRKSNILLYSIDGNFVSVDSALRTPEKVITAGWRAIGEAMIHIVKKDVLLVDFSSDSTSFIPIKEGQILSNSYSNHERIKNNELLFYGVLETNAAFIQPRFEYSGEIYNLPSELHALTADIFLITGDIQTPDYLIDTSDKKAKFKEDALIRLRNMLCIIDESFDEYELIKIAHLIKTRLLEEINQNIRRKLFETNLKTILLTGSGSSILCQYLKHKDEYEEIIEATEIIKTAEINPAYCIAYIYSTRKMKTNV